MHLKNINLGIQMILYVHVANFVNVKQIKSVVSEMQRFQEKNGNICHCRTSNEKIMYTYWYKKVT